MKGDDFLTVGQLARRWQCTPAVVRAAIKNGLSAKRVGRETVVAAHEVDLWEAATGIGGSRGGADDGPSRGTSTASVGDIRFGNLSEIVLILRRKDGSEIRSVYLRDPGS